MDSVVVFLKILTVATDFPFGFGFSSFPLVFFLSLRVHDQPEVKSIPRGEITYLVKNQAGVRS